MIQLPRPSTPVADGKPEPMSRSWLQWLRELVASHESHRFPIGAVVPFSLSAAQMSDPDSFVQAGATAGLGLGAFAGWAVANGNNGTPDLDAMSLRFLVAGAAPQNQSISIVALPLSGRLIYNLVPLMRVA